MGMTKDSHWWRDYQRDRLLDAEWLEWIEYSQRPHINNKEEDES